MMKFKNCKSKIGNWNKGMTYVELIVVLSIFAVMTSLVLFNYGEFQAKVDIKNLASDVALKIVQAQKSSLSGTLPPLAQQAQIGSTWKPSYGVYFSKSVSDNQTFIYFTDLNGENGLYDSSSCPGSGECLDTISITKGNYISDLKVFYDNSTSSTLDNLTISFIRPNSSATLKGSPVFDSNLVVSYVQITVKSPREFTSTVKVYPSGRIQIN